MTDSPLKPLRIPIGLPPNKEIDESIIINIQHTNGITYDEAFETYGSRLPSMICYLCGKSIDVHSLDNNIFLGIPVYAYPTEITQLERDGQSKQSVEYNKKLESG